MASFVSYTSASDALDLSPPDYFDSDYTPTKACIPPSCAICQNELKTEREKEESEKGQQNLQWDCCQRFICGSCVMKNPRLKTYCPFCQLPTSTGPDSNNLISKLPPSYETTLHITRSSMAASTLLYAGHLAEGRDGIEHFVQPTDTLASISLAYNTPLSVLRSLNNLHADNLLHAHRSIFIPATHYQGPSLSPDPPGGEKEEGKRVLVKKFQCVTKCVEVRVAEWYLENSEWNLEEAVENWGQDTNWERAFGSPGNGPGFSGLRSSGSGFSAGKGRRGSRGWGLFKGF